MEPTEEKSGIQHDQQQQGKADTPGQPPDGPIALAFVTDKEVKRRTQSVHDRQQEQDDDEFCQQAVIPVIAFCARERSIPEPPATKLTA